MEGSAEVHPSEQEISVDLTLYTRIYRLDGPLDTADEVCKSYVGKCKLVTTDGKPKDMNDRLEEHIRNVNRKNFNTPLLKSAIEKFGGELFNISSLELCLTEDAQRREIFWINTLGTQHPNGYNSVGGNTETGRYELHEDQKRLVSQNRKGFYRKDWPEGSFPRATIQVVQTKTGTGFKGYHKGVSRSFTSRTISMEERKALALAWHLFGEDPGRLPHARVNGIDAQGNAITQKGVYPCLDKDGNIRKYRGQHPNRSELVQRTFKTVEEASAFAKLLMSLSVENTPAEYLQKTKREARPADMKYLKKKTDKDGDLYGYEVELGPKVSKSGTRISRLFGVRTKTLDQNIADAKAFRDEHLKEPLRV